MKVADAQVAGVMATPDELQAIGTPPTWSGYVAVDDVDAAEARLLQLGGKVLRPVTAQTLSPAPIDQVAAPPPPTPEPGNQGVGMTAEFARALAGWQPPDASNIPSSGQGGSATWFLDCSSGGVNLQATRGWCFAPLLNIFYNVETRVLLHPLTGRIFTVAPGPGP